jgi:hypothetical protein
VNKKVVTVGLLAGGIALTGLTGSAYAEGAAPAGKPAAPPKGQVHKALVCVSTIGPVKGKGEKGIVTMREDGRLPAGKPVIKGKVVPGPAGARSVMVVRDKNGHTTVSVGTPPKGLPKPPPGVSAKGVHCTSVRPGTPGAPPPLPTR